jgi:isopenicillin N synthase-like dioxygenase
MEEAPSDSVRTGDNLLLLDEEEEVWERAADALLRHGVATVELSEARHAIAATAFAQMRQLLRLMDDDDIDSTAASSLLPVMEHTADSAHATGYHPTGGSLSARYNQFRRGCVFSDGAICSVAGMPAFEPAMQRLFDLLHTIFVRVLRALAQRLELPSPDWFESQLGPSAEHSQWHVKEYTSVPATPSREEKEKNDSQRLLLLPTHSDPSLVSVVIHDRPGIQDGGQGLQVATSNQGTTGATTVWTPVPHTGHGVAVLLVGSAMAALTGGKIAACPHRVVQDDDGSSSTNHTRMAATFFGRPSPTTRMVRPPCPYWSDDDDDSTSSRAPTTTFAAWNARVARNYEKSQRKKVVSKSTAAP